GIERRQSAAGDADQKPAVGMNRQSPGVALEFGDQRSGRKAGARELQDLPAGGDVDRAVGVGDDVVDAGQRLADGDASVELVVRAKRAVERRNGILSAVAIDHAADVAYQMVEQSHGGAT